MGGEACESITDDFLIGLGIKGGERLKLILLLLR